MIGDIFCVFQLGFVCFDLYESTRNIIKKNKQKHSTNNWPSEKEAAPGSGILHEFVHKTLNKYGKCASYSVWPSGNGIQKTTEETKKNRYMIYELKGSIPICEGASPVSSRRWHGKNNHTNVIFLFYFFFRNCEKIVQRRAFFFQKK